MAAIMGVSVGQVIGTTFFLGSALGGAAGVLVGLYYTQIDFVMGYSAGLKAFTAAVLGGIGNIRGAMLGGPSSALPRASPSPSSIRPLRTSSRCASYHTLVFRPEGLLGEGLSDREKV